MACALNVPVTDATGADDFQTPAPPRSGRHRRVFRIRRFAFLRMSSTRRKIEAGWRAAGGPSDRRAGHLRSPGPPTD